MGLKDCGCKIKVLRSRLGEMSEAISDGFVLRTMDHVIEKGVI